MTTQAEQAHFLTNAITALNERARAIEETTSVEALAWQPAGGGWSVGQVFEHLCVATDDYLIAIRRVLPVTGGAVTHAHRSWRPSIAGRLLAASMESPRKLPAPRRWQPAPAPRAAVVEAFLARQREIIDLIDRSLAFEWTKLRLSSPVTSLVRMNIGDAFRILVVHAERHFRRIDRVRADYAATGPDALGASSPNSTSRSPVFVSR